MGQGYIQSNPPHVVSWLHLLKTAIVQDPIILLFVDYAISILLTSNQKRVYQLWSYDVKFGSQCIWRQSCNGISSDVILSSLSVGRKLRYFSIFLVTKMKFTVACWPHIKITPIVKKRLNKDSLWFGNSIINLTLN